MTDQRESAGDYEVGYGKPPKGTRFKKGQSGNPKGRPKKPKPDPAKALGILDEPITARVNGKRVEIPVNEAVVRKQFAAASQGHFPSIKRVLRLCRDAGLLVPRSSKQTTGVFVLPDEPTFDEWWEEQTRPDPEDLKLGDE